MPSGSMPPGQNWYHWAKLETAGWGGHPLGGLAVDVHLAAAECRRGNFPPNGLIKLRLNIETNIRKCSNRSYHAVVAVPQELMPPRENSLRTVLLVAIHSEALPWSLRLPEEGVWR